jgi:hypothetical protein
LVTLLCCAAAGSTVSAAMVAAVVSRDASPIGGAARLLPFASRSLEGSVGQLTFGAHPGDLILEGGGAALQFFLRALPGARRLLYTRGPPSHWPRPSSLAQNIRRTWG